MNILIIILARGGSKGIPKKNLSLLGGQTLVSIAVNKSLEVVNKIGGQVILSSDDDNILRSISKSKNFYSLKRPKELATDLSLSFDAVYHAVDWWEKKYKKVIDIVGYLQPNSPFWNNSDLIYCFNLLKTNKNINSVVPLIPSPTHPFKMVTLDKNGLVSNNTKDGLAEMRPRQILPKFFKRCGSFYVGRKKASLNQKSLIPTPSHGFLVNKNIPSVDIDTIIDLEFANFIWDKYKEKF